MRKILNIGTFGLAGMLLGGKKKAAEPAPTPTPNVMPTPDDEGVALARRRSIARQLSRRGRDSTNLTGSTLGG